MCGKVQGEPLSKKKKKKRNGSGFYSEAFKFIHAIKQINKKKKKSLERLESYQGTFDRL